MAQGLKAGAKQVETVEEPLVQRSSEGDTAYEAFLLWCMCNPADRSNRLIAKSLATAESNVRLWKRKYGWAMRAAQVPSVEYVCLELYRARMRQYVGKEHADKLRAAMDVVLDIAGFAELRSDVRRQRVGLASRLDGTGEKGVEPVVGKPPPKAAKTPLTAGELERVDPARYMRDLAWNVRSNHLKPDDLRRQILLIDAVLGMIAKKVSTGDLKVEVRDIPSLLKARALLTGLPTEQIAVQQHVDHKVTHVVESVRMARARKTGNDQHLLAAMREEVQELSVILQAVPNIVDITPEVEE